MPALCGRIVQSRSRVTAAGCGGIIALLLGSTQPIKKGSQKPMWIGRGFDSDGDGNNDVFVGTRMDRGTQELISKILSPIFVLLVLWVMGVVAYKGVGYLLGWDKLTVSYAAELANSRDETLVCYGVTRLDPVAASALAQFKGRVLSLNELTELDVETIKALVEFKGQGLYLSVAELSDEAVKVLAQRQGDLGIGLTTLSVEAAKALMQHKGSLGLKGLATLSDDAARALAQHKGPVDLGGLTKLSERAAKMLRANPAIWLPDEFKQ